MIKTLTNEQLEWILSTFFQNDVIPGWRAIALKLITSGECLTTPSARNTWRGNIGNFIDDKEATEGVGLILLTFDRNTFFSKDNKFFMEHYTYHLEQATKRVEVATVQLQSLQTLI